MEINKEISALIYLLEDPDLEVFAHVRSKLVSYGTELIPNLENSWELNTDQLVQSRIEDIVHSIHFNALKGKFEHWLNEETNDLVKGATLVCSYQYPELNVSRFEESILNLKKEIWLNLGVNYSPLKTIKHFNRIFYDEFGFKNIDPENKSSSYLYVNQIISSKKGDPIALGTLYAILGSELDLPLHAVKLPNGQLFLVYLDHPFDASRVGSFYRGDIHFYIDPGDYGRVLTAKHIEKYLSVQNYNPDPRLLLPLCNCALIKVYLERVKEYYETVHEPGRAAEVNEIIELVERRLPVESF